MSDKPPKRPLMGSHDFLKWGKEFLKDALSKPGDPEERQTRPLAAPSPRKKTTLLTGDAASLVSAPRGSVSDLARLNIVFVDNAHRPLYEPLGPNDAPFSSEKDRMIMERCVASLREVRDRLAAVEDLVPRGHYGGLTLDQVLETASTKDLRTFFYFVRENPRFFVGKALRVSEAFVAWVIDHGEAEARP